MAQEENHIQAILADLLAEDRQLLGNKDGLIEKLKERISAEDQRDFKALRRALSETNIGEILLVADSGSQEEKEVAEATVRDILNKNMQQTRAQLVMDTLTGALGWHEETPPEAENPEESEEEPETDVQQTTPEEQTSWDCVCGCKNNKKNFCKNCGKSRAEGTVKEGAAEEDTWTCGHCGKTGNKNKFCKNCGTPREGEAKPDIPLVKDNQLSDDEVTLSVAKSEVQAATMSQTVQQISAVQPVRKSAFSQPQTQVVQVSSSDKGTQRAIIGVIVLLVCVLGFMGYKEMSATSKSDSSSYHSLAKSADNSKASETNQLVAKSELSLGGIDLDISLDEMRSRLGKEKSHELGKDGYTFYFYDGLKAGGKDGLIKALVSDGPNCTTKKGIHEGSALQEVIEAYGSDAMKTNYEGLVLYEYNFKSLSGNDGILRFAINGQNKVDYISVRIPETPKVDTQAVGNAAKEAVASYHKYITNRDYKAAYNLLTPDMQNTMGLFENWTQGFRNTIESRATDLQVANVQADSAEVSFILVARDRRPGGGYEENKFRSTATVVKTDSGWKIAAVNNKKI